jgi:hypothetical protein
MNDTPILDAIPVRDPAAARRATDRRRPVRRGPVTRFFLGLFGWAWVLLIGTVFCGPWFLGSVSFLNYLLALLVLGWLTRWTQGRVLYAWWKRSPRRSEEGFADFRGTLGPDAPVTRPRWFLREDFRAADIRAEMGRPTLDGEPPDFLQRMLRAALVPFRSLGLNFKMGLQALVGTSLLMGWGCLAMTFSWEFGWLNSFNKGYELALFGPGIGLFGIALFALAMLYVPMAQVHHAVTGSFRAFFDFRFVCRLILARLTAYVLLAMVFLLLGVILEVLKTAPAGFDDHSDFWTDTTDRELLFMLRRYYFGCTAYLFVSLLLTRLFAAAVYRSAVLKVLRRGRVKREELHPVLAAWFDRLGIHPPARPFAHGFAGFVRRLGRKNYRRLLYVVLFLTWVAFAAKTYVGEFLNYHPVAGFLNHPLIQLPSFDYIPQHVHNAWDHPEPRPEPA